MLTMAQYGQTVQDKMDWSVIIDELVRGSYLFQVLPFDDTMTNNGQSSYTYGYVRKNNESGAAFRQINGTYTDSEAAYKKYYANIAILGGTYKIDRSFIKASKGGFIDEVTRQNEEKVKSTIAAFHNAVINGDTDSSDVTVNGFDGLKKILTTTDEANQVVNAVADLSTVAKVEANAVQLVDDFEVVLGKMNGCDLIICNKDAKRRIAAVGRKLGAYQMTTNDFGCAVETYAGIPIMDAGDKVGGGMVIPTATDGTTDVYFVKIGASNLHGITLNNDMIDVVLPTPSNTASEQLRGLVEVHVGICLKSTKGVAVLKGLKVAPASSNSEG